MEFSKFVFAIDGFESLELWSFTLGFESLDLYLIFPRPLPQVALSHGSIGSWVVAQASFHDHADQVQTGLQPGRQACSTGTAWRQQRENEPAHAQCVRSLTHTCVQKLKQVFHRPKLYLSSCIHCITCIAPRRPTRRCRTSTASVLFRVRQGSLGYQF